MRMVRAEPTPASWNDKVRTWFSEDGVASKWDEMYASDTDALDEHFFRLRREYTLDYVRRHYGAEHRLLDLGCGAGPVISQLRAEGFRCSGVDYSTDMLKLARTRITGCGAAETLLAQSDARALPFRDTEFDFIVCLGVISYLQEYSGLLAEIHRLLKPGGQSIITFRNKYNPVLSDPVAAVAHAARSMLGRNGGDDDSIGRFLSPSRVQRDLEAADLEILAFQGIGYGPLLLHGRPLLSDASGRRLSDAATRITERLGLRFVNKWWTDVSICVVRKA